MENVCLEPTLLTVADSNRKSLVKLQRKLRTVAGPMVPSP
jgi:hypothetical protein